MDLPGLFLFPGNLELFLGRNEEKSPEIAFGVAGLPLCACKPETMVTMTLHAPRTLPGLFVHPTWGSGFSVERFYYAFVGLLHPPHDTQETQEIAFP